MRKEDCLLFLILGDLTLVSMVVGDVMSGVWGQTRDLFQAASLHTVLLPLLEFSGVNASIDSYTTKHLMTVVKTILAWK